MVERSFWELPLCSANRALLSFFMVKDVFGGGNNGETSEIGLALLIVDGFSVSDGVGAGERTT